MTHWSGARELVERLFMAGLAAVEPRAAVRDALRLSGALLEVNGKHVPLRGRLIVIAIGKAATTMAAGAADVLGDRIDTGIILAKDGHLGEGVPGFEGFEARHPLPDERGIAATTRILEAVSELTRDDVVLALISGGGSALFEAPVAGVSLSDFQATTDLLLRAGAPIQHLNAVRSQISQVKGGGLREAIGPAVCVSLILSDVLGNNPSVIASGPTVPTPRNSQTAIDLIASYGLEGKIPEPVSSHLTRIAGPETQVDASRDVWQIVADNRTMLEAMEREAIDAGLRAEIAWRDREGEARELGRSFVELVTGSEADVVLGGGEATVTVNGSGSGGRNTEFALAAALALAEAGHNKWVVASLGSDGEDGSANAAGAIADPESVRRGEQAGISAAAHLAENDSAAFFAKLGGLVQPGPTGTNVNDVYIAVRAGT